MESTYLNRDVETSTMCEHCGDKVDVKDAVMDNGHVFCCSGCLGVSKLIHSLGLGEYYNIKDFNKHNFDLLKKSTEEIEDYSYLNQKNFREIYTAENSPCQMDFYIEGIHCTGCLWLIENLSETTEEIESVELKYK